MNRCRKAALAHGDLELDTPCGIVTAQVFSDGKGPIDARRHAGGEDELAVDDDPLVDRLCAAKNGKRSSEAQCVVARLPCNRPAAPSSKAPVQTEKTFVAPAA